MQTPPVDSQTQTNLSKRSTAPSDIEELQKELEQFAREEEEYKEKYQSMDTTDDEEEKEKSSWEEKTPKLNEELIEKEYRKLCVLVEDYLDMDFHKNPLKVLQTLRKSSKRSLKKQSGPSYDDRERARKLYFRVLSYFCILKNHVTKLHSISFEGKKTSMPDYIDQLTEMFKNNHIQLSHLDIDRMLSWFGLEILPRTTTTDSEEGKNEKKKNEKKLTGGTFDNYQSDCVMTKGKSALQENLADSIGMIINLISFWILREKNIPECELIENLTTNTTTNSSSSINNRNSTRARRSCRNKSDDSDKENQSPSKLQVERNRQTVRNSFIMEFLKCLFSWSCKEHGYFQSISSMMDNAIVELLRNFPRLKVIQEDSDSDMICLTLLPECITDCLIDSTSSQVPDILYTLSNYRFRCPVGKSLFQSAFRMFSSSFYLTPEDEDSVLDLSGISNLENDIFTIMNNLKEQYDNEEDRRNRIRFMNCLFVHVGYFCSDEYWLKKESKTSNQAIHCLNEWKLSISSRKRFTTCNVYESMVSNFFF